MTRFRIAAEESVTELYTSITKRVQRDRVEKSINTQTSIIELFTGESQAVPCFTNLLRWLNAYIKARPLVHNSFHIFVYQYDCNLDSALGFETKPTIFHRVKKTIPT